MEEKIQIINESFFTLLKQNQQDNYQILFLSSTQKQEDSNILYNMVHTTLEKLAQDKKKLLNINYDSVENIDQLVNHFQISEFPSILLLFAGENITNTIQTIQNKKDLTMALLNQDKIFKKKLEAKHEFIKKDIENLLLSSKVFAFIKGAKDQPKCKFSKSLSKILEGQEYETQNILDDYPLREQNKEIQNWKTYPQLFVNGEFIGGYDVIKELHESGELKDILSGSNNVASDEPIGQRLSKLVKSKPVMLFIKGTINEPACGFTSKLLFALKEWIIKQNDKIGYFNILEDNDVREGLKEQSMWKTQPQVQMNGEFIGGSDVVMELIDNNEMGEMFDALK